MAETATLILRPFTLGRDDGYSPVGAGTEVEACDPGDPINHDDDSSYASIGSGGVTPELGFKPDTTFSEKMALVTDVTVRVRGKFISTTCSTNRLIISLNSTDIYSSNIDLSTSYTERNASFSRPGGGDWTEDDFRDSSFEWGFERCNNGPETRITSLWCIVTYVPLRVSTTLERDIASRRLFLNRIATKNLTFVGGWEHLQGELLEKVAVSHTLAPNEWGLKDWERGFGTVNKQIIDLGSPRVTTTITDRRYFQSTYWEIAEATIAGNPNIADGLPRLDGSGAGREFTRDSIAWSEEVGGVIRQVEAAQEKITPTGELLEEQRTNLFTRSSFVSGTTGWSSTGAGTFATDSSDLLFESGVTAQSAKLTYVAPSDTIEIFKNSDSLSATTAYTLSIDHKDDSEEKLVVSVQNTTTGNYLQAKGGSTWGALAKLDLTTGTGGDKLRDQFNFTTEGTASTHEIRIYCETTAGQINHVYHVQVEAGEWASSRIVTDAAAVTREPDFLALRNDDTLPRRVFPVDRFTCRIRFLPQYLSADAGTNAAHILTLDHGANNWIRVYQTHGASGPVTYEYRSGGTTYSTTVAANLPSRDSANGFDEIIIQKTSSSAESVVAINDAIDWSAASTAMRTSSLAGSPTDGPKGTLVAWVRMDGGDGVTQTILSNNQDHMTLERHSSNEFRFFLEDSSNTQLVDVQSSSTFTASATWRCIMISWDLTTGGSEELRFYVGDTDEEGTVNTLTAGNVDYVSSNWGIAADFNGASPLNGATSLIWCSFTEFIDFDVESNRRKFFGSGGELVAVRSDGTLPTGNQPELLFHDDVTTYNINSGSLGGTWTYVVTPSDDGSPPTGLDVLGSTENDEDSDTILLYVNAASSKLANVPTLTEAATSTLSIGSLEDGTNSGNMYFKELFISPFVLDSTEILFRSLA